MKYLVLLLSLLAFTAQAEEVAKPKQTPVEEAEPECD